MHYRHTEIGYIVMVIYFKLHLNVPMNLKVYVSQSVIYTCLKGNGMHSYRFLGEFNNNPVHPYLNLDWNLDISKKKLENIIRWDCFKNIKVPLEKCTHLYSNIGMANI